jgi:hypothetical protein
MRVSASRVRARAARGSLCRSLWVPKNARRGLTTASGLCRPPWQLNLLQTVDSLATGAGQLSYSRGVRSVNTPVCRTWATADKTGIADVGRQPDPGRLP